MRSMLTFLEAARYVTPIYFNYVFSEVDASFWSFVASDIIADFDCLNWSNFVSKPSWLRHDIQQNNTTVHDGLYCDTQHKKHWKSICWVSIFYCYAECWMSICSVSFRRSGNVLSRNRVLISFGSWGILKKKKTNTTCLALAKLSLDLGEICFFFSFFHFFFFFFAKAKLFAKLKIKLKKKLQE